MEIQDCKIGMTVAVEMDRYGSTIQAEILKINNKTARVKTLSGFRRYPAGTILNVGYLLLHPLGENGQVVPPVPVPPVKLTYHPFQDSIDVSILEAISSCYNNLSPENLTCDGEASRSHINQRAAKLHRQLKGLFYAFGREVGEMEALDWEMSKRDYEEKNKVKV